MPFQFEFHCVFIFKLRRPDYIEEGSSHGPVHRSMISASGAYRGEMSRGISSGTTEDWPPRIESNWTAFKREIVSGWTRLSRKAGALTIDSPSKAASGVEARVVCWLS